MKVLWITNILLPEAKGLLTSNGTLKNSGGWLVGASEKLASCDDIQLCIACISSLVKTTTRLLGERIIYYVIPIGRGFKKYNSDYEKDWIRIRSEFQPDVVHIHGTEYTNGLSYVNACGADNVVVSIQGMKSACHQYYYSNISVNDIIKNYTLRDIFKGGIFKGKADFKVQGLYEIDLLRKVNHIIGRTTWDKAHSWAINPKAKYHFCNETLRQEFYTGESWNYTSCRKHTIFLSQGGYPLKGLHQVLKALPFVLSQYPNTEVRIAGPDITRFSGIQEIVYMTGYGRYIKSLIKSSGLENNVCFIGNLSAEEMKMEYLNSNLFVCPSAIENSPNSLGEAQLLGVPCIASYVGGIPDMMVGFEEYLYRFDEYVELANLICRVFSSSGSYDSQKSISISYARHEPIHNLKQTINIYKSILNSKI